MAIVYVVSEEEGAGKTALTAALAHVLREQGQKATALKPIASGSADPDSEIYRELLGQASDSGPLELPEEGLTPQVTEEVSSRVAAAMAVSSSSPPPEIACQSPESERLPIRNSYRSSPRDLNGNMMT